MMKTPHHTSASEISVPRRCRISRSSFLLMVPVLSKSNACTKQEASREEVAGMGKTLKFSIDDDHYARMFRGGSTLIRPKGKEKVSGYKTFLSSSRVSNSVDGVVTV
jgi:hypothetical protein